MRSQRASLDGFVAHRRPGKVAGENHSNAAKRQQRPVRTCSSGRTRHDRFCGGFSFCLCFFTHGREVYNVNALELRISREFQS